MVGIISLSNLRRTDTRERATTVDVTMNLTALDLNRREPRHGTSGGTVVLFLGSHCRSTIVIFNNVIIVIVIVKVVLVLTDTRTSSIDITIIKSAVFRSDFTAENLNMGVTTYVTVHTTTKDRTTNLWSARCYITVCARSAGSTSSYRDVSLIHITHEELRTVQVTW